MADGDASKNPGSLISDCTVKGHNVKFFSDTECKNLMEETTIGWGPKATCARLGPSPVWLSEVPNEEWMQEQERKSASDDDTPEHWKAVEAACTFERELEPECIDAWYHALDMDNGYEWMYMMYMWFNNQPWLALFGLPLSWYAGAAAFYFLFFPDRLPHISDAPWDDVKPINGLRIKSVTLTANMMKPDAYFFT